MSPPSKPKYLETLKVLLRPVALFSLRHGIKTPEVLESLKSALVDLATEELSRRHEKTTKSKLAIMTGLQRRDVTRLLEAEDQTTAPHNIMTKIIGQWRSHPDFSKKGVPRKLTVSGAASEFFSLVQSISKDLNPYTILFELERIGAVKRQDELLELSVSSYNPRADLERSFSLVTGDTEDLIKCVEENVLETPEIPNLHIKTTYDNISSEDVPSIRQWILKKGAEFHAEIRAFLGKLDKDLNPSLFNKSGGTRVCVGSFSRIELAPSISAKKKEMK
jgi:hypothetical protein